MKCKAEFIPNVFSVAFASCDDKATILSSRLRVFVAGRVERRGNYRAHLSKRLRKWDGNEFAMILKITPT